MKKWHKTNSAQSGAVHLILIVALIVGGMIAFIGYRLVQSSKAAAVTGPIVGLTGKCLDNDYARLANYNKVQLWDCHGGGNQHWSLTSNGTIQLQNYCLDVNGASRTPGTVVQLYTCNGTPAQTWSVRSNGTIVNPNSGLCLDVRWANSANGTQIQVYTCNGTAAQNWKVPAGTTTTSTTPPPTSPTTAMPTSNLNGFTYVGGVDFLTDALQGKVASSADAQRGGVYDKWILAYSDKWYGNFGGRYAFNDNATVDGGTLKVKLRTLNNEPTGAAWIWKHPSNTSNPYGTLYGAFEQRVRVTGNVSGYGGALLLWPDSEIWNEGEIDFPEGDFGQQPKAYHHCVGNPSSNCSVFQSGVNWSDWHTYRIEWNSTGTAYYVDGRLIGKNTNSTPRTKFHWVNQMALSGTGESVAGKSGVFEVDWVRFLRAN